MEIAWLNDHLLYFNGGIRYMYEVARRLGAVDIYTGNCSQENLKRFNDAGLDIYKYSKTTANKLRYWLFYPYYVVRDALSLKKTLLRRSYDIVITSSPTTHILTFLQRIKPILVVFELNPWLYDKEHISGLPLLKRLIVKLGKPIAQLVEKMAYKNARKIIATSIFVQSEIKRVYGLDSEVIHVAVDTDFFKRVNSELQEEYKYEEILLHVASFLSPRKGTKYAIEAMKYIVKEIPNAYLLILVARNDIGLQNKLIEYAAEIGVKEDIQFISGVKDSDMPKYYSLAKVLLNPSLDENTHYTVLEAAACECPVVELVGTRPPEDMMLGKTGYQAFSSYEMAKCATKIIQNHEFELGKNARQFVLEEFSYDKLIESYKRIIDWKA